MSVYEININFDTRCAECGKPGATDNGLCLKCTTRAITGKPMKSATGKAVGRRRIQHDWKR